MAETKIMTHEQIECMAEALYRLAAADWVDEREVGVIREFLEEVDHPAYVDRLGRRDFDPSVLPWVLATGHLRRLFLKSCYVLVQADGRVGPTERKIIGEYSVLLGLQDEVDELEASVLGVSL